MSVAIDQSILSAAAANDYVVTREALLSSGVGRSSIELDGRRWHSVTAAQNEDRRRDRVATAHGWAVARFGWQEIVERPSQVLAEVRHLLRTRPTTPTGVA